MVKLLQQNDAVLGEEMVLLLIYKSKRDHVFVICWGVKLQRLIFYGWVSLYNYENIQKVGLSQVVDTDTKCMVNLNKG